MTVEEVKEKRDELRCTCHYSSKRTLLRQYLYLELCSRHVRHTNGAREEPLTHTHQRSIIVHLVLEPLR